MKKSPALLIAVLALVAVTTNAEAKLRDNSWEISGMYGHIDGDVSNGVDNSTAWGVSFGYNITAKLAAVVSFWDQSTTYSNPPDFRDAVIDKIGLPICNQPLGSFPRCLEEVTDLRLDLDDDSDIVRTYVEIMGSFLTDRETRTLPYISAGLGVINETRPEIPFIVDFDGTAPCAPSSTCTRPPISGSLQSEFPEAFDSSAILTLAVGARTFLSDNWAIRYEARYFHHDSFGVGQDEYLLGLGASWVIGGSN